MGKKALVAASIVMLVALVAQAVQINKLNKLNNSLDLPRALESRGLVMDR